MNFKKIIYIYKKELLDLMRDKRTVITSIVIPIVLYPLLMVGFTSLMIRQESKLEKQLVDVYIQDNISDENSQRIIQALVEIENLRVKAENEYYENMLKDNFIQAFIEINDSLSTSGYHVFKVTISYNETNEKSKMAFERIRQKLYEIEKDFVTERLSAIQINEDILNAVDIEENNVAPPEQMLVFLVGKILPYLLIMLTMSGGAVVASDLVAGEKERGTLETILVSAAKRIELVIGKYLTIITISLITVLLNLFSMYISFSFIISQSGVDMAEIQLPISNFILILIAMIPLLTLLAAILLSISTYARNIKEAQSYTMPILFAGMMLAMISMFPAFELTYGFALIPIVNFSLLFRNIMMGDFELSKFFVVVGSTIVLDIIAISVSIKLFKNESVLFRTVEEKSLKFWGKEKKNVFSVQFVIIFFIIILMALFYLGGTWQAKDLMNGLFKTEIFIILFPTILVLRISRSDIKKTLRMNYTKPINYLIIVLMSIPVLLLAAVMGKLINYIYPVSESYLEGMKNLISVEDKSVWLNLFVVALIPGICEETMFRGYIINAFKKRGFWVSIIITAVLFGILHLDLFRMIPVTLLGIYMGYLLLKTNSIFPPMIAHFLNNGLAIIFGNYSDKIPLFNKILEEDELPLWIALPSLVILFLLLKLFTKMNTNSIFVNNKKYIDS